MYARVMRLLGRRVQVSCPMGHQYGHLAIEMQLAYAQARAAGLDVFFVRPRTLVNPALFELEAEGVRRLRPGALGRLWLSWRWAVADGAARARMQFVRDIARALKERVSDGSLSIQVRRRLRVSYGRLSDYGEHPLPPARRPHTYLRRRLYVHRVPTMLPADDASTAAQLAEAVGIAPSARLVCLHVRTSGFKQGAEQESVGGWRQDNVRNASIETHLAAIDYLVSLGYTVVRLGDPSMPRLERAGVVDLATSSRRDPRLEVHCLLRARFILCGESGPFSVSFLTNTPLLCVNGTDPIGAYPVRADGLLMMKTIFDVQTGAQLRIRDLLTENYISGLRDPRRFHYVENSAVEILDAVKEMLAQLEKRSESPAQAELRQQLATVATELAANHRFSAKWGADRGFMGDGRFVQSQADDRG